MLSLPPSVVARLPHPPSLTLDVFQFSFSASNSLLYLSNWTSFHLSLVVCVFKCSFFDLSAVKILPEAETYVTSSAGLLIWRKNKTKDQVLYRSVKMQKDPRLNQLNQLQGWCQFYCWQTKQLHIPQPNISEVFCTVELNIHINSAECCHSAASEQAQTHAESDLCGVPS